MTVDNNSRSPTCLRTSLTAQRTLRKLIEKTHDDNRSLWVDDNVEKNTISVTTSTFHQKQYILFHTDSIDTVTYWK